MKLRLWPLLWMVYEPLCRVGVLPQPAVVAADAAGAMIVVTATPPAATTATAPSTASQRGAKCRVRRAFTAAPPLQMVRPATVIAKPSNAADGTPRAGSGGVLPQRIQPVQADVLPRLVVPQRGAHRFTSAGVRDRNIGRMMCRVKQWKYLDV